MNNLPYPDKPGVPLNPEKDGFHWIKGWNETPFVAEWFVDQSEDFGGYYGWHDGADNPQGIVAQGWSYLGPCLKPSEVAAQIEQARREGVEAAMRVVSERVSARHKEAGSCISDRSRNHMHIRADEAGQIVTCIRSLLPGDSE